MPVGQEKFQQLLQVAAEGVIVIDAVGRMVWVNSQAERLFGYSPGELLGQLVETLVPEEQRQRHQELRQAFLSQPRNRPMGENQSLQGQRKDGMTFPVEVSLSYAGAGDELRIMAMIQDITARRQMEAALRRSEGRYRAMTEDVLDTSAVGTLVVDADDRVIWFNRAFGTFFRLLRQEWPGRSRGELLREGIAPWLSDPRQLTRLDQLVGPPPAAHIECHLAGDDETPETWLACHSQPIANGIYRGGRIDHFYDITLIKELELAREAQFEDHIRGLEFEIERLMRLVKPADFPVAAQLMGVEPLQQHLPDVFDELVEEYAELLDLALENRVVATDVDLPGRLARLGESLGFLRATPRDLIDLHRQVLSRRRASEPPQRLRGLLGEGRLLLIELMGDLTLFYRRKAILLQRSDELPPSNAGEVHGN